MNLLGVRTALVHQTGRFDLVVDAAGLDFSNATTGIGADFYINEAQVLLDSLVDHAKTTAWYYDLPADGDMSLDLQYCRALHRVWIADGDERFQLVRTTEEWLRQEYPLDTTEYNSGQPAYWAPRVLGLSPEQEDETAATFATATYEGYEDLTFGDHYSYNGIVWMGPSDGTWTFHVLGDFQTTTLSADADLSYWTAVAPYALIHAARLCMEGAHRNSEGMKDIMAQLQPYLTGIDKDQAMQDVAMAYQMEG